MSFIKKLRLSKRLPSVLSKSFTKQSHTPQLSSPNGLPAITEGPDHNDEGATGGDTTLDESMGHSHAINTLNTTNTTSGSSTRSGSKVKPHETRCLVVYHIDSETEGTLSLTARVCIYYYLK